MAHSHSLWRANAIAFDSSFCVMVMELIAARILAPYIGVSLYTWTSIIGVILAGIAAGNYVGGKVADRYASPLTLMSIFFAGGLATIAVQPAIQLVAGADWFDGWPLMLSFTLKVSGIFLVPAFILSMVSPLVIKLTLADLGRTGGVVGTIYAFSTAGSILGTFLTGFYFIDWFGTRMIVWLLAGVLILTGIVSLFMWKVPDRWKISGRNITLWTITFIVVASSATLFQLRDRWQEHYTRESNYFAIRVLDTGDGTRTLSLDHLLHSYVKLDDPTYLKYPYLQIFSEVVLYTSKEIPGQGPRFLHLGGGGYSFPRYLEVTYPESVNHVIEIDQAVTEIVYDHLGLSRTTAIRTFNMDARLFMIQGLATEKYDFIIGDVFNDYSTPFHLTTLEFGQLVKKALKPDGAYLVNIIDNYRTGRYMPSMVHTLRQVFRNVYLIGSSGDWANIDTATFVILATDRQLDTEDYRTFLQTRNSNMTSSVHDQADLEELLSRRDPVLLTDDHAPTDILVARVLG